MVKYSESLKDGKHLDASIKPQNIGIYRIKYIYKRFINFVSNCDT